MKTWRVYQGNYGNIEVVQEGFNFWAFFLPGFWGFAKGLYGAGFVGVFGVLTLNRLLKEQEIVAIPLIIALMALYGTKGNSWVIASLVHDGYRFVALMEARTKKTAKIEAKKLYNLSNSGMEPTVANFSGQRGDSTPDAAGSGGSY